MPQDSRDSFFCVLVLQPDDLVLVISLLLSSLISIVSFVVMTVFYKMTTKFQGYLLTLLS